MSVASSPLIISDADNTLWDTDAVFATAQLQLLAEVEDEVGKALKATDRLGWVREIDQTLAESHPHGLRYPPHLLVRGIAKSLLNRSIDSSSPWEQGIAQAFSERVRRTRPTLRDGVREGLQLLREHDAKIVALTEGPYAVCVDRMAYHDLTTFFTATMSAWKSPTLFLRLVSLMNMSPNRAVVIGDQLDRDIVFAREAGIAAVYFPGGFAPRWTTAYDPESANAKVNSYSEAALAAVRAIESSEDSAAPGIDDDKNPLRRE